MGYLGGAEDYFQARWIANQQRINGSNKDFWSGRAPAPESLWSQVHYSTNYYSRTAVQKVQQHDVSNRSAPLFVDLRYQGVHGPYEEPPLWEQQPNGTVDPLGFRCGPVSTCQTLRSMVAVVDSGIGNITQALTLKQMWSDTLIIFSAGESAMHTGRLNPFQRSICKPYVQYCRELFVVL
eukprot:COSAG01_NODE_3372_length_6178_cov_83.041125_4_plen_180_part_00